VYQSITSATSGYSAVATVATTSWTSASLANNNYWYEVTATIGTNWTSTTSAATARRTITTGHCA
jgi:hypothetical protein